MSSQAYVGSELELFAAAVNWKSYLARQLRPHFGDEVLEVGAGLGTTTAALFDGRPRRWVCLEPDGQMVAQLNARIESGELPSVCQARGGILADLPADQVFDTILYVDVLEHIEDDRAEMELAAQHLKPGGRLVVLAPAHNWLYTPFDKAIGHFRRYNKSMLAAAAPANLPRIRLRYLDSVGLLASLANRLLLQKSMPSPKQIWVWDRFMVRPSRWLDPLLFFSLGKSVLGVWQK
ncbi:MAG: class I SAM-dependent methyltransferase [Gemmataceae bacterium]